MFKARHITTLIALSMLSLTSYAGPEKIYKWVDSKGETHYGHTIPPEFADRDRFEIDKTGRIIKKTNILNAEERAASRVTEAKQQEEAEKERDRTLRDKSLLNTYSNVKEIDLARARNLQQIDARAAVAHKQLGNANDAYEVLKNRADTFEKAGKPIPAYLREDLNDAQINAENLTKEYAKLNSEKSALEERYDDDKARYKLLTGK
ncbi:MAG: DUF4124 domain-containing protein [Gallionella sp.]|nr:DUF4124 domain-containing protein [Gallionella sp.]